MLLLEMIVKAAPIGHGSVGRAGLDPGIEPLAIAHSLRSDLKQDCFALERTDEGAVYGDLGAGCVTQAYERLLREVEFVDSVFFEHGLKELATIRDNHHPTRRDDLDPGMMNSHLFRGGRDRSWNGGGRNARRWRNWR